MLIPFAFGTLLGVTLCHSMRGLHSNYIWWFAVMGSTSLLFINWRTKKQFIATLSIVIVGAMVGFSWVTIKAKTFLAWTIPQTDIQKEVVIKAKVCNINKLANDMLQLDALLIEYQATIINKPAPQVRLFWTHPKINLQPGDIIVCRVKLKIPWRYANPGSVDTEKYYFLQNIRALGQIIQLLAYQNTKTEGLARLRLHLNDKLNQLIDSRFKGIIIATTLGFNQHITPDQWQVFQKTGTLHAIAISGAHISAVAWICNTLVIFIVRRVHALSLWLPAQQYGAFAGFMAALIYSAISGYSIPTQRAFIMAWVVWLALVKRQALMSWSGLAIAWLIIGFLFPFATLQTGFWLSFGCVAALIYGRSHCHHQGWRKWLMPQCIVFIALIPACAFFFQQIPVLSILANTLMVPVTDFLVVPCSLLGLFFALFCEPIAILLFKTADLGLQITWFFLEKIAYSPISVVQTSPTHWYTLICASLAALWLLLPSGLPGRHIAWFAFVPLFYSKGQGITHGEFKFALLDVGQGLAAMVHTQHHHLLFDAGPRTLTGKSAGTQVIMPYLNYVGINQLDKVMISHSDLDHRGGLSDIKVPILDLISSDSHVIPQSRLCLTGEHWQWDGVDFEILNGPDLGYKDKNNASCVLKVSNGYHSILLTGDIEKVAEQKLLKTASEHLKSTILVAPHHGSKTSSCPEFIQAVKPTYVLFPVGLYNRYGFPHEVVHQRYAQSQQLLSYQTGAILFHIQQKQELTPPIRWRETDYHYWNVYYQEDKR